MIQEKKERWNHSNLQDPHVIPDKHQRVYAMFDSISGSYDLLNHVLSLNLDRLWRRKAVEMAQVGPGESVLDICCGTGDLALAFVRNHHDLGEVIGLDFVESMLEIAIQKSKQQANDRCNCVVPKWLCGDAQKLDFNDNRFDCVSCAFGIRNLQDVSAGLFECFRVLKPGGRLVILEFAQPNHPVLSWLYACYFRLVLPLAGSIISNDRNGAYRYLPESVRSFRTAEKLENMVQDAGFSAIHAERLSCGAVWALVARKQ